MKHLFPLLLTDDLRPVRRPSGHWLAVVGLWALVSGCETPSASPTPAPDADGDGATTLTDCNDSDAAVHPDADELCNGVDDNCNGSTDESPKDGLIIYPDQDMDGYAADTADSVLACTVPFAHAEERGDCEDLDPSIHPLAIETCDQRDEDCDFDIDEDAQDLGSWYEDLDADGYGNPNEVVHECTPPTGFVASSNDCWDLDAQVHPDAAERCNLEDDNCDLQIDEGLPDQDANSVPDCQEPVLIVSSAFKSQATESCENMQAWMREAQQIEYYLQDMGLSPHRIDEDPTNGVSAAQVQNAPFLIWINGGASGNPKAQTVATLSSAGSRNQGLLFIGDDMAKQAKEYQDQTGDDTLMSLTWLSAYESNGKTNDGAQVVASDHPVIDGWEGRVTSFGYREDIDIGALVDPGPTLLMKVEGAGDNPAVWAVDVGQRTVVILPNLYATENRCPVGQSSDLSSLSTLFKNATAWILRWT